MESINSSLKLDKQTVIVTGGAGFIGGALISFLLEHTDCKIVNIDKLGYASDLTRINTTLKGLNISKNRYKFIQLDLFDKNEVLLTINQIQPDFIFHLAAESHVDNSIKSPEIFLQSNVVGTFNLLEAVKTYWYDLSNNKKANFRFLHISTDEVFGSLEHNGFFTEDSPYDPRSPYSASKAASDHFVKAYFHTYGIPILITNCSNNYGPWQYPEKLIPVIILNGLKHLDIPIYGDGEYIRDWIFVDDHINALIKVLLNGRVGNSYCIGATEEHTNNDIAESICSMLDLINPNDKPHTRLIKNIVDRPGHDRRYAIDSSKIRTEIGWQPKYNFQEGIKKTVSWYYENQKWCYQVHSLIHNN
ncbi:dTDP-glucose 4,6-dehydratase [Prochlorococcus marinus]|uniref:dTDP-glucose 4,6-dehydratase n=1 Tax=Prochlorococcus marinus TaxID=1219 RepID=UPI001C58A842|nr:dTDP-glucose 4,6-dehydratase [Prochlorococcus marinus]MBW3042881.1 dTDP-glucose 4,6-dehydratase [Prochlorococcus marinus str. XMU1408]